MIIANIAPHDTVAVVDMASLHKVGINTANDEASGALLLSPDRRRKLHASLRRHARRLKLRLFVRHLFLELDYFIFNCRLASLKTRYYLISQLIKVIRNFQSCLPR